MTPLFYYKDSNWKFLKKALLLEDANAYLDKNANQCMKVLTFLKRVSTFLILAFMAEVPNEFIDFGSMWLCYYVL